jgi:hypothetical protein
LREKRIRETGLRQYVYDLLGDRANWESARFTLWRGGKGVSIPPKWRQRRLVDYLATLGELPERIEVEEGGRNIQLHM